MLGDIIKFLHKLIKYKSYAGLKLKFSSTKVNLLDGKCSRNPLKSSDHTKNLVFSNFLSKKELIDKNIISSVSKIIEEVSIRGDEALIDITKELDNHMVIRKYLKF